MKAIEFRSVTKTFGDTAALSDFSISVEQGEFLAIIGPSGSGKTTLLRLVNRLAEADSGIILVNGQDNRATDPVALRRGIGYVLQQPALFPHMNVFENITYVLRLTKTDKHTMQRRAMEMIELVDLEEAHLNRYPHQLSGGQRQRVGIARALAAEPAIMLMDEPLNAVDGITRMALQEELLRIHTRLGTTMVLVTHDLFEAKRLGDRIAVIHNGELAQIDSWDTLQRYPALPIVAHFTRELMPV